MKMDAKDIGAVILAGIVTVGLFVAGSRYRIDATEPNPVPVTAESSTTLYEAPEPHEPVTLYYYTPSEVITEKTPIIEVKTTYVGTFTTYGYCPCEYCCGKTDGITYTGTTATAGRTIAVDPSVIPLGSTVIVNGVEYIAEDIGGAIKGNKIDVFYPDHETAREHGVQSAEVYVKEIYYA